MTKKMTENATRRFRRHRKGATLAKQLLQAKKYGTPLSKGDFIVKAIPQLVADIAKHGGLKNLDETVELVMVAAVVEDSALKPLSNGFYRAGDKMYRSVSTLKWPVSDDALYPVATCRHP